MFKTKIIALFLVPGIALYSLAANLVYKGTQGPLFELRALGTTGIMAALCALVQDLLPRSFKEAVVFWRVKDRLPGCRAFTRAPSDRFDLKKVINLKQLKNLSGGEQQRVFYKIYKKHEKDAVVAHYSFRYCAWRDLASLYLLLAIVTVPSALTIPMIQGFGVSIQNAVVLATFSFVAYLLTALAARQSANALVGQVLSCETAEHPHAISI